MTDQVLLHREHQTGRSPLRRTAMDGPKTILVHIQSEATLCNRLENALSLARASGAHLHCLHVTPYETYAAYEGFGGILIASDAVLAIDEQNAAMRARVEAELKNEDVSWNFTQATGNIVGSILSHAALSDLIVTGREQRSFASAGRSIGQLGDLVSRSRTPIFIASDQESVDPTAPVIIAWDSSQAAADAVRGSISLLKLASAVHVVAITEYDRSEEFPGTLLLEFLSRHGIHAELSVDGSDMKRPEPNYVAAVLMGKAASLGASYIVMGGYNHSRIGEFMFGGVTRKLLTNGTVPIVIAH